LQKVKKKKKKKKMRNWFSPQGFLGFRRKVFKMVFRRKGQKQEKSFFSALK